MDVIMTVADVNIESAAQGTEDDKLAELLRETAMHHDRFENATLLQNWRYWYARSRGGTWSGAPMRSDPSRESFSSDSSHYVNSTTE
jgi:hypothetical protein